MAWFKNPSDIKVGVIGYGGAFNMGRAHLNQAQQAGMRPFAVCELDATRLAAARTDFPGIEAYGKLEDMLAKSQVDLVVHITPHNLHFPLALKCLQAGKHVVTEKPFVLTTAECDRLIAEAKRRKRLLSTYHNRHWDGCILRAVDQVLVKKAVGEVVRVDAHWGNYDMPGSWWRTSKSISGGVMFDWGVHLLEYSLQMLPGAQATEVTAQTHHGFWAAQMPKSHPWKNDCNEDDAMMLVRFDSGAMVQLTTSTIMSYQRPGFLEVMGTLGTYTLDWQNWTLRRPHGRKDPATGKPVNVVESGPHWPNRNELYYQNLAEYLTGKAELVITPEWARRPIHILDLACRSAQAGKALPTRYG
jgi:predicted dehydrogenase